MISFYVPGMPMTQGSKTAFVIPGRHGRKQRVVVTESTGEEGKCWRAQVRDAAIAAWGDFRPPLDGPVAVVFRFDVLRPLCHFTAGRVKILRRSAPAFPTKRPDVLKWARSVEDSLTSVIYRDDSQIVTELLLKRYALAWGAQVELYAEPDDVLQLPECKQLSLAIR